MNKLLTLPLGVAVRARTHVTTIVDINKRNIAICSADVKMGRYGLGCQEFLGALFAEADADKVDNQPAIFILGFHNANYNPVFGIDVGGCNKNDPLADPVAIGNQRDFIDYIRREEESVRSSRGVLGQIFSGWEYPVQVRLLDAYCVARRLANAEFCMSYISHDGKFVFEICTQKDLCLPQSDAHTQNEAEIHYAEFDAWANSSGGNVVPG